jgi:hypothetical protein
LQFPKKFVISVISVAKPKNIVVFAFTFVMESFGLFYGDFCMDLHSVASDEAMKWWSEAMKQRFIASIFKQR